jgi:hypothetical protein
LFNAIPFTYEKHMLLCHICMLFRENWHQFTFFSPVLGWYAIGFAMVTGSYKFGAGIAGWGVPRAPAAPRHFVLQALQ